MADILQQSSLPGQRGMQQPQNMMQTPGMGQQMMQNPPGMNPQNPGMMQQNPGQPKSSKKWIWITGLVILILIALLAVWWFVFKA